MNKTAIALTKIWEDPMALELKLDVHSATFSASIDFYTSYEDLQELADNLSDFLAKGKSYSWIQGEDVAYVKLRFFKYDNLGHIGIEFLLDNRLDIPEKMTANFFILAEIGQLDFFVAKIAGLAKGKESGIECAF